MEGFDYSTPDFSAGVLSALHKAGATFVMRYLGTSPKCMGPKESAALEHAGFDRAMYFETTGTTWRGGRAAGQKDAAEALSAAKVLNIPVGVGAPIFFAVDEQTTDYATVNEYLGGCAEVLGTMYLAKVYGSFDVVENAPGDGHAQTYAWSSGRLSKKAGVYQYLNGVSVGGVSMDHCRLTPTGPVAVGGWLVYTNDPAPTPAPAPAKGPVTALRNHYQVAGNASPRAAAALKFERGQNSSGASGWKGECAGLVRTAYGILVSAWGKATRTAAGAWVATPRKYRHGWYNPPAGVPVFWTGGGSGAGHVALADGQGNCWSSDFGPNGYIGDGRVRLVPIASISKHDAALKYVGWTETYLGVTVYA